MSMIRETCLSRVHTLSGGELGGHRIRYVCLNAILCGTVRLRGML